MSDKTIPTFGYRAGEAKLFQLAPGEALPEGWFDTPQPDNDPEPEAAPTEAPKKRGRPKKVEASDEGGTDGDNT